MNKKLLFTGILVLAISFGFSQSKEELEAQKAEKKQRLINFKKRLMPYRLK